METTFQFPLCLLAYHKDRRERMETIIAHALVTTGIRMERNMTEKERQGAPSNYSHRAVECSASYCGVSPGDYKRVVKRSQDADRFISEWKSSDRKTPIVRMLTKIVFEVRDGKGMTYDDFSILCAINAAMGRKTHAVVTKPRIRAGMMGYNSGSWLFSQDGELTADGIALLSRRDDGAQPYTPKQLRHALDRLEKRGCFSRFRASARRTYFSAGKMTAEEIGLRLVQKAEDKFKRTNRITELQDRLRALNKQGPLNRGPLNRDDRAESEGPLNREGPHGGHSGATDGPHDGPHVGPLNASLNASLNAAIVMLPDNASKIMRERELPRFDGTLSRIKRADGSYMTTTEADEFMRALKAQAGL